MSMMLCELKSIDSVKGRQEDGEEFLGFLLEGLHEELFINKRNDEAGGISNFLSVPMAKPSHVKTIEDALVNLTTPEVLEGFMSMARGGVRVDATKQNYIESLPPVLILHLKRFVYDSVVELKSS
ncbi:hypothetical protein BSLG_001442 [Batrachochytrium salamandrivorans]|nr:hypothetical protein BSLG_001442 [Batrachochytrium salamandrivorans]